jgi:hypothetical protein
MANLVAPHHSKSRKALKRIAKLGLPVQMDPFTGRPLLDEGVHEAWRPKIGNPFARHYGVLVCQGGIVTVYDLQADGGPRAIHFHDFAAGNVVYVTKSVTSPGDVHAALARLQEAWSARTVWNLFQNNCEHWAKWVVRGEKRSHQVEGLVTIGVIALAIRLLGGA